MCDLTVPPFIKTGSEISCPPGSNCYPPHPERSPLTARTFVTINPLGAVGSDRAQLNRPESGIFVPV